MKLTHLVGCNFVKSEPLLSLIEDSLRMRLNYVVKNEEQLDQHYDAATMLQLSNALLQLG